MTDEKKHDSRVIDRDNPLCEVKVLEQLTRTPRDAMYKYIEIQVGAFNVMNRNNHVYKISEKDLVDKVEQMHGCMVGELSQTDVLADMTTGSTPNRFEQIAPDKCYGVLTDSAIVRQCVGSVEWLNVLGTVRLNPGLVDKFNEIGGKYPTFAIRATTRDDDVCGQVIKNVHDIIAFDLTIESAVHVMHRYPRHPQRVGEGELSLKPPVFKLDSTRAMSDLSKLNDVEPYQVKEEVASKPLNLYLVERDYNDDVPYEDIDSMVVAAASEDDARRIDPTAVGWAYPPETECDREVFYGDHLEISDKRWNEKRESTAGGNEHAYMGWVRESQLFTLKVTLIGVCTTYTKPHLVLAKHC